MSSKKINVRVFRFDPSKDVEPRYETYPVPYEKGMTVLQALMYINDILEPVSFRYECRFQDCGSCGVMVNGKPVLACKQAVKEDLTIEPLPIYPVIKDLVIDVSSYYRKRSHLKPFLERTTLPKAFPEPEVTYEVDQKYRKYVDCLDCHLCQVVCPVLKEKGTKFIGPAFMTYLARFKEDPRDELDRITIAISEGVSECTLCGECEKVCPVGRKITELDIMPFKKAAEKENAS